MRPSIPKTAQNRHGLGRLPGPGGSERPWSRSVLMSSERSLALVGPPFRVSVASGAQDDLSLIPGVSLTGGLDISLG